MSLEKVNPGESIKASTVNSLIDAVKGQNIPSQGNFIQTAIGPVYSKREKISPDANLQYTQFLETCIAPDSSNSKRAYVYVGNPLDSTFSGHTNLKCSGQSCMFIASYDGTSLQVATPKKLLVNNAAADFDAKENFTGSTPEYYNGWYKTNITQGDGASMTLYGHFFQLLKHGQTETPPEQREPVTRNLFVISKESNPYQLQGSHPELALYQDSPAYDEISAIEKTYVLGELNTTSATNYWNLQHTGPIDDSSSQPSQPEEYNFDGLFVPNVQASLSSFSMTSADVQAANPDMTPEELSAEIKRVAGKQIIEFYNFHDPEAVIDKAEITANGYDAYDFVMRQKDGVEGRSREVVYYPLSTLMADVSAQTPDSEVTALALSSLQRHPESDISAWELFGFHDLEYKKDTPDEDDQYVIRHPDGNGGAVLQYGPISSVINPIPDSGNGCGYYSSLEKFGREDDGFRDVWQIYKFADLSYKKDLSALNLNGSQVVVREDAGGLPDGVKVRYVPVEQLVTKTDSEGNTSKSIEKDSSTRELRLFDFTGCAETYSSLVMEPTFKDFAADGYSVLARQDDDGAGPRLKYFNLKYLSRYADDDVASKGQSSLETCSDNNSLDSPYFQLYDFSTPTVTPVNFTLKYDDKAYHLTNGLSTSEDVQLVVRNAEGLGKEVQYYDFTITAPKVGIDDLTQEVINQLTSSHCDCGEKWTWISGVVQDLSSEISGDYWESGGDSSTCYGSDIGNSNGTTVIDLDNQTLESNGGYWYVPYLYTSGQAWINELAVGATYFDAGTGDGHIDGSLDVDGCLEVDGAGTFNSDVYVTNMLQAGCVYAGGPIAITGAGATLQIGNTTLNEQELIRLKQLLQ